MVARCATSRAARSSGRENSGNAHARWPSWISCNVAPGIAFAFHPHRDTWYSAPHFQLNWWLPIFAISEDNGLAFHPRYWETPIQNSSRVYNYAEWNATSRKIAATQIGTDTDIPWGLLTLPDGAILYSRRDAHDIVRLDPATGAKSTVGTVPDVQSTDGEGGLLGLAGRVGSVSWNHPGTRV